MNLNMNMNIVLTELFFWSCNFGNFWFLSILTLPLSLYLYLYRLGGTSVSSALECPPEETRSIVSLDTSQMVSVYMHAGVTYWRTRARVCVCVCVCVYGAYTKCPCLQSFLYTVSVCTSLFYFTLSCTFSLVFPSPHTSSAALTLAGLF